MAKQKKTRKFLSLKEFRIPKPVVYSLLGVIAVFAFFALALAGYTIQYKNKVYPRTYVGEINLGGNTRSEALKVLHEALPKVPQDITIIVDDKQVGKIAQSEIDFSYTAEAIVEEALAVGRIGSVRQNIQELFRSLVAKNSVTVLFHYNDKKATELLTKTATSVGTLPVDAKIVLNEQDQLSIQPSQEGNGVTPEHLHDLLITAFSSFQSEVKTTSQVLKPKITQDQALTALTQTQQILARTPLILTAVTQKATADNDKVFSWLTYRVSEPEDDGHTSSLFPFSHANAHGTVTLEVAVEFEKVKSFVKEFSDTVNVTPSNAQFRAVDTTITVVTPHQDGKKVKVDETTQLLVAQLVNGAITIPITLEAEVDVVLAEVRDNNIETLGIKELIGRAETTYKGSPENRQHNIATGAKFLNGILIPPGQEFSTVKTLGKVDGSTGYLPELVIKENRTTPEFGGGLCQVSTTLFRSVLNAGLKVTERSNHSYRVSYYEPPVGLDATIYLPKPDFKFVNDTPGYILIQNKIEGTKITFELYGTKDGRASAITDPVITSTTPAGDPIYADTDTLKKGETKQIEKSHDGATTVVTYTVTRDGQEINKQVFRSRYKAWPARFLVGTREE